MKVELFGDEEMHRLFAEGQMKIIQSPSIFSFSLDAVLLAHFARVPRSSKRKILDLCAGHGVVPLLLSPKTNAQITGVEVQGRLVHMAERSITYNGLTKQITMICADLRDEISTLQQGSFDFITCNPPYFKTPANTELNENEYLTIARHEVLCTLEDVVKACKFYVRPGGRVAFVYRPNRLVELITLLSNYRLEPKRLRFVYPKIGKDANIVLVEAVRDGKQGLQTLPPLVIYEGKSYTKEAEAIIYGKG